MTTKRKARAAVVGATGVAGQQFLTALADHPSIELVRLAASARSAGKTYREAITQASGLVGWYADGALPQVFSDMTVENAEDMDASDLDVVFSAVDTGPARELEPKYAAHCPVISTASAFRYEVDVPLLLPGVNMDHVGLLASQKRRGWKGFVAPGPNCTTVGLAMTLAPLHKAFGVRRVHMVSMQAVSGAGRSPGVASLDILDNIIPYIPSEEGKVEKETQKVLGQYQGGVINPAAFPISSTCTRVAIIEGHTEVVHVELEKAVTQDAISMAWREFGAAFTAAGYPSAPDRLIGELADPYRPQVRLDRDAGSGMTTTVGRLRPDANVENGWKYLLVSHNTKMGAAKGAVLMAEHFQSEGLIRA